MIFNSYEFMIFLPVAYLLVVLVPRKWRVIVLLAINMVFYGFQHPLHLICLWITILITWAASLLIEKKRIDVSGCNTVVKSLKLERRLKVFFVDVLIVIFGILFILKYTEFFIININKLLTLAGFPKISFKLSWSLPIGVSFYTFIAAGYLINVFQKKSEAEHNILTYAAFVSFFPTILSGPIERSDSLLKQLKNYDSRNIVTPDAIKSGAISILFGLFMKMCIADRISILVDTVYSSYQMYGSTELLIASFGYSIQVYCDFAGYSLIAFGVARILGFKIMENFNTPYFAQSIKDFWRRWHISLSSWLRDYVYFPLGGGYCSKARKCFNIFLTFLVSGIWHGASWSFILWGIIHGIYQIIGGLWE